MSSFGRGRTNTSSVGRKRSKYGGAGMGDPNFSTAKLRKEKYAREALKRSQKRIAKSIEGGMSTEAAEEKERLREEKKKSKRKKSKVREREKLRGGDSVERPAKRQRQSADVDVNLPPWQIRKFDDRGVPFRPMTRTQQQREFDKKVDFEFSRQIAIMEAAKFCAAAVMAMPMREEGKGEEEEEGEDKELERLDFLSNVQIAANDMIPKPKLKASQKAQLKSLPSQKAKARRREEKLRRKKERRAERQKVLDEKVEKGEITLEQIQLEKQQRKDAARAARIAKALLKEKQKVESKRIVRQTRKAKRELEQKATNLQNENSRLRREMGRGREQSG